MARNVQIKDREKRQQIAAQAALNGYTQREWNRLNELDRQEKKKQYMLFGFTAALVLVTLIMCYGVYYVEFRSHDYALTLPYDKNNTTFGVLESHYTADTAKSFSADLCVTDHDINASDLYMTALSAGIFDLTNIQIPYAKDVFTTRSPASLTKIMTAYVALKYGNLDDLVTVTETAKDIEYGSSVCGIVPGDVMSLKQLIYGMIIASGNDAAMMIAEHIGGSVDNFVTMMNQEARNMGATRTHFTNPHGLTDSKHYTCVYDLYLMFNEAMKYDLFMDMISRKNYYAEYMNIEGKPCAVTWESTNHYFTGEAFSPDLVNVYGGKTGTTDDAGACLALLSKDQFGNPYLNIILHSADKEVLYNDMNKMLQYTL